MPHRKKIEDCVTFLGQEGDSPGRAEQSKIMARCLACSMSEEAESSQRAD